jgi:hypothetical protein
VSFFKALAVFRGTDPGMQGLDGRTPHKPGDNAPTGDAVQHGNLFGHLDRIIEGDDVAQHGDLGLFGDFGNDCRIDIDRGLHTPVRGVVLVGHNPVKAHLIGPGVLVMVVAIEHVGLFGIKVGVGEVHTTRLVGRQIVFRNMAIGLF